LKKDDLLIESLTEVVKNEKSGVVIGLGALRDAELMLYNLENKEYFSKKFVGPLEVGSFTAVIAKNPDDKTGLHAHITISSDDFKSYSGHLKEAHVGATFEAVIFSGKETVKRVFNEKIGLNLLNI
jgi:predicted DNA-binding protein with PD1-like motif